MGDAEGVCVLVALQGMKRLLLREKEYKKWIERRITSREVSL